VPLAYRAAGEGSGEGAQSPPQKKNKIRPSAGSSTSGK